MFVPCDIEDIPSISRKHHGKYVEDLDRFIDANIPAAEYIIESGKDPAYVTRALFLAVYRNKYPVEIVRRKDRIFLVRK